MNKQEEHDDEKRDYEGSPALLNPGPTDADTAQARDREHERKHRIYQSIFDGLLVLFTAITAGIGIWQGKMTRDAVQTAARQAKAAEEANRQTAASIEVVQEQNRPWIKVTGVKTREHKPQLLALRFYGHCAAAIFPRRSIFNLKSI